MRSTPSTSSCGGISAKYFSILGLRHKLTICCRSMGAKGLTASADENADLFWAVRGGGGNFGVVTSFQFQAHPVHTVCAGPMLWHLEDAADVMKWYREFIT